MGDMRICEIYFNSNHFRNLKCHSFTSLTNRECQWPHKEVKKKLGQKMTLNMEVITSWGLVKLIHPRGHIWPHCHVIILDINLKKLQLFIPWGLQDYNNQRSKFFFFGSFFTVKFFTPKFMKIKCYLGIFVTFESGFQIKLTINCLSLSLRCVSMSELELV